VATAGLKTHSDRRKLINEKPIFHQAPAQGAFYVSPLLDDRCSLWRTSPDHNDPTDKEKTMSTKLFNYFDDYKTPVLECPTCHWRGTFEQGSVEYHAELADSRCPNCDFFDAPMLAIVSYPTLEEARARSDRPGIREWVQAIDRGLDEFEAQKLRTPEQLPEISADNFTLVWDFEADEDYSNARTLIKHGDVVIFSEPARFEEYRRFEEVAEILKAKYGDRVKDLVPTERSELYLYGDDARGYHYVDKVRACLFGTTTTPREGKEHGFPARSEPFNLT
jgi:hypothetical protein